MEGRALDQLERMLMRPLLDPWAGFRWPPDPARVAIALDLCPTCQLRYPAVLSCPDCRGAGVKMRYPEEVDHECGQ